MLALDLVGGWTSPQLLVRVLALGEPDWEPLRAGFTRRSTGERVTIAMASASPALAARFAAAQPFRPPLDEALLDEIAGHRAVVAVSDPRPATPPLDAAATLVRAAGAVVNAGALAVRCRTSGVVHDADAFLGLVAAVDRPDERVEALVAIYVAWVAGPRPSTLGMSAFGVPEIALDRAGDPDLDLPRLRGLAFDRLRTP